MSATAAKPVPSSKPADPKTHPLMRDGSKPATPAPAATGKPAEAAPATETKRQRFLRLGAVRMGKALNAIRVVGNLSSANYEYTPEDVAKIKTALESAVSDCLKGFAPKAATAEAKKAGFTF